MNEILPVHYVRPSPIWLIPFSSASPFLVLFYVFFPGLLPNNFRAFIVTPDLGGAGTFPMIIQTLPS